MATIPLGFFLWKFLLVFLKNLLGCRLKLALGWTKPSQRLEVPQEVLISGFYVTDYEVWPDALGVSLVTHIPFALFLHCTHGTCGSACELSQLQESALCVLQPMWCLVAAAAKSLQLCLTLCDPIDGSPSGAPVPGILQARTLEWVAISFSDAWKWKVKVKSLSRVQLWATPWTAAHQAPPSMGFSRQEFWSGVPLPSLVMSLRLT